MPLKLLGKGLRGPLLLPFLIASGLQADQLPSFEGSFSQEPPAASCGRTMSLLGRASENQSPSAQKLGPEGILKVVQQMAQEKGSVPSYENLFREDQSLLTHIPAEPSLTLKRVATKVIEKYAGPGGPQSVEGIRFAKQMARALSELYIEHDATIRLLKKDREQAREWAQQVSVDKSAMMVPFKGKNEPILVDAATLKQHAKTLLTQAKNLPDIYLGFLRGYLLARRALPVSRRFAEVVLQLDLYFCNGTYVAQPLLRNQHR